MKNAIIIVIVIALSSLFFLDCFMFPGPEVQQKTKIESTQDNGLPL